MGSVPPAVGSVPISFSRNKKNTINAGPSLPHEAGQVVIQANQFTRSSTLSGILVGCANWGISDSVLFDKTIPR